MEAGHDLLCHGLAVGGIFFPVGAGQNILLHGHVGKQGIALEQQSRAPLLGSQIDPFFRVEQGNAIHDDPPFIGLFDSGDTF